MEEKTGILKQCIRMIGMYAVGIAIMLIVILLHIWMNQIDPKSEKITPNTFFCALGKPLEKKVMLSVNQSEEIFQTEQSISNMVIGYAVGKIPELDLLCQMYQVYAGKMEAKILREKAQILVIPENASAIESVEERQELKKSLEMAGIFDFLHTDMRLYAWNVEKTKKSGVQITEIHVVMCFDEWILIGTSIQEGNHSFRASIQYGRYEEI